ncbi:hypothetical protein TWF225_000903 [Orbilia oligospora]|nr:hypothetical protein TWF225_000903 [Orbilia oligospora]KAF3250575.1 hypothetical protein TWF128_007431 [Orbilia oligospora]KAF3266922.1 hypothetical protein TWF217_001007 [Orbilia oligospora]KAF3297221.1 hypothetical protein TWF132_007331 [Orbilia oligospora]
MFPLKKNRRACDRCRAQKLSCKRMAEDSSCIRCSRAQTECYITPGLKKTIQPSISRPSRRNASQTSQSLLPQSQISTFAIHPENSPSLSSGPLSMGIRTSSDYTEDCSPNRNNSQKTIENTIPANSALHHDIPYSGKAANNIYQSDDQIFPGLGCSNFDGILAIDLDIDQLNPVSPDHIPPSPVESLASIANDFDEEVSSLSPLWALSPSIPATFSGLQMLEGGDLSPYDQGTGSEPTKKGANLQSQTTEPRCSSDNGKARSPSSNDWIKTMTELNTKLYLRWDEMHFDEELTEGNPFAIDEIFLLSQNLIDLYNKNRPDISRSSSPLTGQVANDCDILRHFEPKKSEDFTLSESFSSCNKTPRGFPMLQDPASIFLLLSSRLKLLNIYQKLLLRLQSWKASSGTCAQVPSFNAGPFNMALQASPNLRAIFILQFMEHFLFRLRKEPASLESSNNRLPERTGPNPLADVADNALEEVRIKEIEILTTIRKMQRTIQVG